MRTSKCCTCGHEWQTGTNGSHSCTSVMEGTIVRIAGEVLCFTFIDVSALPQCGSMRLLCEKINELKRIRDEWMEKCGNATQTLGADSTVFDAMHQKLSMCQKYNRDMDDRIAASIKERDDARAVLGLVRPYVESASKVLYDGGDGQGIRDTAKRRLEAVDACAPTDYYRTRAEKFDVMECELADEKQAREKAEAELALERAARGNAEEASKQWRRVADQRLREIEATKARIAELEAALGECQRLLRFVAGNPGAIDFKTMNDIRRAGKSAATARSAGKEASETCSACNGRGEVGNITDTDTCPHCNGTGSGSHPSHPKCFGEYKYDDYDPTCEVCHVNAECRAKNHAQSASNEAHSPDCDLLDTNPEGIVKPCNCHVSRNEVQP